MKLTNRELVESLGALQALQALTLPARAAYRLGVVIHQLDPFYKAYNEQIKKMQDSQPVLAQQPEPIDGFNDEIARVENAKLVEAQRKAGEDLQPQLDELLAVVNDITQEPLPLSLLRDKAGADIEVSVRTMQALTWLFAPEPAP